MIGDDSIVSCSPSSPTSTGQVPTLRQREAAARATVRADRAARRTRRRRHREIVCVETSDCSRASSRSSTRHPRAASGSRSAQSTRYSPRRRSARELDAPRARCCSRDQDPDESSRRVAHRLAVARAAGEPELATCGGLASEFAQALQTSRARSSRSIGFLPGVNNVIAHPERLDDADGGSVDPASRAVGSRTAPTRRATSGGTGPTPSAGRPALRAPGTRVCMDQASEPVLRLAVRRADTGRRTSSAAGSSPTADRGRGCSPRRGPRRRSGPRALGS